MKTEYKIGTFMVAFIMMVFIQLIACQGCTPKIQAQESDDMRGQVAIEWYRQQMTCQYKILHITHDILIVGESDLNALARQGWKIIDTEWVKSGTVMHGFYTLERCE